MSNDLVLITGVTGYLGSHVLNVFTNAGYKVRGSVRSLKNEARLKPLRDLFTNVELVEVDLLNLDSIKKAVKGCTLVIHVASPFPSGELSTQDEILKPAINGTLNVLEAACEAGVKRVVVTSSELAVMGAVPQSGKEYSDKDWGDENTPWTYCKSKILAEKAAWNFVEEKKKNNQKVFELAVVNPSLIIGPMINNGEGTSSEWFSNVLFNKGEKVNEAIYPTCDVRDVALAHFRAATIPEAAGHRFIIVSRPEFISNAEWAAILKKEFEPKGYKIANIEPGDGTGKNCRTDMSKMRDVLKITPTDFTKTVIDMANSLISKKAA